MNTIWPIINPDLYKCLKLEEEIYEITKRCKHISESDNGIQGIANLDPVLIHPVYGVGSLNQHGIMEKKGRVGEFGGLRQDFWLYEMTGFGRETREKQISYALYAYIAPRELSKMDQEMLTEYEGSDPDYVRGVKEGWSILFLGACQKYVISPGIVPRAEMARKVKEGYRKMNLDITYLYSNGTKVFGE